MEMTTHQKDIFNFIHYDSHKLLELYLPSNFKEQRPGTGKKKQNPNTTKQYKATGNSVKRSANTATERNKNTSAAGASSAYQNNF